MQPLRDLARQLLADGTVSVVVGYEEGPLGVRPSFATTADETAKLVFDHRAVQNLATYLNPRRRALLPMGKPAIVVKPCDAAAVAGLLREQQLSRDDMVLIGVRCPGVTPRPDAAAPTGPQDLADRCAACTERTPHLADHVLGDVVPVVATSWVGAGTDAVGAGLGAAGAVTRPGSRAARLAELEAMDPGARWAWWSAEFARCIRCHACREVCPLCFCERCLADKSSPQWIESSPHPRGNTAWNISRALHLAGRCVGCGECERACPADIPLGLINAKLAAVVAERFDYRAGDDPSVPAPIGSFRTDDGQEFIR